MAHPLASTLKFLKSPWLWGSIVGIFFGGYIIYVYWIFQLDDKELRAEHREWAIGLLFPAVVGGGGYLLSQQSENRAKAEQEKEEAEAKIERDLREKLAQEERQEQREQSDLKYYFDRISTLVVENGFTKDEGKSEANQIARILTANILRELKSAERMNQVMSYWRSRKLSEVSGQTDSVFRSIELNQADLQGLNASGVDFQKANLREADLSGANLWKVNFTAAANLRKAKLVGSVLAEAVLIEAILIDADLSKAHLYSANLSKANLLGVDLRGPDLRKANFSEVNLGGTILSAPLSAEQREQCKIYNPIIVEPKE